MMGFKNVFAPLGLNLSAVPFFKSFCAGLAFLNCSVSVFSQSNVPDSIYDLTTFFPYSNKSVSVSHLRCSCAHRCVFWLDFVCWIGISQATVFFLHEGMTIARPNVVFGITFLVLCILFVTMNGCIYYLLFIIIN